MPKASPVGMIFKFPVVELIAEALASDTAGIESLLYDSSWPSTSLIGASLLPLLGNASRFCIRNTLRRLAMDRPCDIGGYLRG